MQVYREILVTMDCSPVDRVIVEHVARLAQQNQARVTLLHVIHSHTLDQERALRSKAEAALQAHEVELRARGVETRIVLRSGEPEKQVLSEIEAGGYDLVAMATHGHRFMADALFGSVSRSVKHHIRVPLLLLRADAL